MCGRYAVTTDPARLAAEIDAVDEVSDGARNGAPAAADGLVSYNVAPSTTVMTVVDRHDHGRPEDPARRRVRAMRWGLVPSWSTDVASGPLLFNARAETLAEKPAFRRSLPGKRALIPMDGWYEWRPGPAGSDGKPSKIPFYMRPRDGSRLFMGALWAAWRPPRARAAGDDSEWLSSTTIITTDAVGPLTQVHHRMPLIMPVEHWDRWLDPDRPVDASLLAPPDGALVDAIEIREVAPLVNRVANDGPELIAGVCGSAASGGRRRPAIYE
ncbi:SOS response-associated peptidase [Gordonia shandongensis]|uniref:SOS response-associated peptidase n=1 Tax=Gordonia shandongensis TaxID=376351 RepID=UPI0003F87854|nr:SOS response-associated peptidase [Gordonia shandongensis]